MSVLCPTWLCTYADSYARGQSPTMDCKTVWFHILVRPLKFSNLDPNQWDQGGSGYLVQLILQVWPSKLMSFPVHSYAGMLKFTFNYFRIPWKVWKFCVRQMRKNLITALTKHPISCPYTQNMRHLLYLLKTDYILMGSDMFSPYRWTHISLFYPDGNVQLHSVLDHAY